MDPHAPRRWLSTRIGTLPALALVLAPGLAPAPGGQEKAPVLPPDPGPTVCVDDPPPPTAGGPEAKARRLAAQDPEVPVRVLEGVEAALDWLARQQAPDGSWSAAAGPARSDVRATALALLAFFHDGNTTREGRHREAVVRGVRWLKALQDGGSGRLRDAWGNVPDGDHALGALALVEAYYFSRSPLIERTAHDALEHALRTWGEGPPVSGAEQVVTLAWIALALERAGSANLRPEDGDRERLAGWLERVADPVTGRCGLPSSEDPPRETATAAALLARLHLVPDPVEDRLVALQAAWLDRALTQCGERGLEDASPLLAFLGARALQRADRRGAWLRWQAAVDAAACAAQAAGGEACGSWSPRPPYGRLEGTALTALALETRWQ